MTVSMNKHAIVLSGSCGVEEADALVGYLESRRDLPVDLSQAETIHTALWQALMIFKPKLDDAAISSLMVEKIAAGFRAYMGGTARSST